MGIDHLLPRHKEGWGELLILLVVVFAFHYIVFFSCLHHSYDLMAYEQDYDPNDKLRPLLIEASFPKYFADFDVGYIYVEIEYESPNASHEVLWVYIYPVECSKTYYDSDINFLSDSLTKDNAVMGIIPLYPGEAKFMRLPFYSAANIRGNDNITCTVKVARVPSTVDDRVEIKDGDITELPSGEIQANRMAVLSLRVIGQLLLNSPWSNILLVTLVVAGRYFFSIYEDDENDKEREKKELSIYEFVLSILRVLMGIALIYEMGLMVTYVSFWRSLVVVLIFIIAGYIAICYMNNKNNEGEEREFSVLFDVLLIGVALETILMITYVFSWKGISEVLRWVVIALVMIVGGWLVSVKTEEIKKWYQSWVERPLWILPLVCWLVLLEIIDLVITNNSSDENCPLFLMGAALGVILGVIMVVPKVMNISLGREVEEPSSDAGKESKDTQSQNGSESGKGEEESPSSDAEQGPEDSQSQSGLENVKVVVK